MGVQLPNLKTSVARLMLLSCRTSYCRTVPKVPKDLQKQFRTDMVTRKVLNWERYPKTKLTQQLSMLFGTVPTIQGLPFLVNT